jgi:hypothetical protein
MKHEQNITKIQIEKKDGKSKMKKSHTLLSILGLVAMIVAAFFVAAPNAQAEGYCGTPDVVTLWAGQTIDAGTVTVSNDEFNLYVTFTTANDWLLSETHLHVADSLAEVPQTKKGNPKIGNFAYQTTHDPYATEHTYTIAKDNLSLDDNNSVVVAAHASVVQVDSSGNVIDQETGWGAGDPFVDKGSWAMYFQYTWQECSAPPPPQESGTETAFAFGGDVATCFLNIDDNGDGVGDFNRWGWTNGLLAAGSYTFEAYAGAGQCDLTKGTLVGTLTVDYDGSTATVTFNTAGINPDTGLPYTMVETHLYVGSEMLAQDNGQFTVAPGQYSIIHNELANVTSDSYTITGLSGEIYVVAHATVAGFPID